jgi:homoserine O-acetyltransferase
MAHVGWWLCVAALTCVLGAAAGAADAPPVATQEGDFTITDFAFRSGETLPELRLHYTTLGSPHADARGRVSNGVLILHGTGGSGRQFLRPQFADVLFAPGGLLDPARFFIILPDGIGHGKSSKPSDGLRAKFPHYDYDDMVAAHHALVKKGLGVDHLRLIMGTSMGCMHAFVWGETYPSYMDALMPLACLPVEIAGRNRMWRTLLMDAIRTDPAWKGGDYTEQPLGVLRTAEDLLFIAGSAPLLWQKSYPTRDAADTFARVTTQKAIEALDANDLLYQVNASRNYDPSSKLARITAPVMWINSADDFINPPELGIAGREGAKLRRGRFILLPASEETRGHGTHTWAALWQRHLKELLDLSEPEAR